jgi:hypothetical protein
MLQSGIRSKEPASSLPHTGHSQKMQRVFDFC